MTFAEWLLSLPEDERDEAEERAAIREHDGRMRRDSAERLTMKDWASR